MRFRETGRVETEVPLSFLWILQTGKDSLSPEVFLEITTLVAFVNL